MKCPSCGAELLDSARFCEMCGAPLPAQDRPTAQGGQVQGVPIGQAQSASQSDGQSAQFAGTAASDPAGQGAAPASHQPPQPQPQRQGQYQPPYDQPAGAKQGSNAPFVLSIIALVTAVLGLFPVSIVLAIIALAMNSGQKKRGEASTKQTPTFVMGLIGLILSILMFLFTMFIGGVLWLAVLDDEIDLDDILEGDVPVTVVTTSSSSSSSSASASSSKSSSSSSSSSSSKAEEKSSSASSSSAKSSSSAASSKSTSSSSKSASDSYGTSEIPTLADFDWFTADMIEGKLPEDAKVLTSLDDVEGGWKAYAFGSGMERFLNIDIDDSDSETVLTFNWGVVYDGDTGQSHQDDTPASEFTGLWVAGLLDATGSGNVSLTDFWQKGKHQYAVGSFLWPSGEVDNLVLVRP